MMVPEQITETIEHPFQRLFRRACCFLYPESFKWFQCNRGFERGHMSLSILFTQDDVAGERQSDIDIPLQCLMRKFRIARAEDLMRRMIHPELLFELCLNIDLGDDAEFLFQKGFTHPCLCFLERERERYLEAVGGGWHRRVGKGSITASCRDDSRLHLSFLSSFPSFLHAHHELHRSYPRRGPSSSPSCVPWFASACLTFRRIDCRPMDLP